MVVIVLAARRCEIPSLSLSANLSRIVASYASTTGILGQERFQAETTSAGFFKLRSFDKDRSESFLTKNLIHLRSQVRGKVAIVDDDAVSHEVMRFVGIEQMNPLEVKVQRGQGLGGKCSRKDQRGVIIQRTPGRYRGGSSRSQ